MSFLVSFVLAVTLLCCDCICNAARQVVSLPFVAEQFDHFVI